MFSWISKDEAKKKTQGVYDSVAVGLRDVYKSIIISAACLVKTFFRLGQEFALLTKLIPA